MAFSKLFNIEDTLIEKAKASTKRKLSMDERGCDWCTLNEVKGITKIKGSIKGRKILVVAQSPGPEENEQGKELVGPSGQLFWTEVIKAGISPKDCDRFNVTKCFPADWVEGSYNAYLKMRSPSNLELHCCSIYTEEHMKASQAKQIIVLGAVAAKALLNVRTVPTQKSFWSDQFQAKMYLLDHPAFFLRGYGDGPRMEAFCSMLKRVAEERDSGVSKDLSDDFGYIRTQDYRLVTSEKQALEAEAVIRSLAAKGRRVAVDIESDEFEDEKGHEVFCVGFCPKPGLSFVFVFRHRDVSKKDGAAVLQVVRRLIEDAAVEKVLHYGCSDVTALQSLEC